MLHMLHVYLSCIFFSKSVRFTCGLYIFNGCFREEMYARCTRDIITKEIKDKDEIQ